MYTTGIIRFNERNGRERISNGGQVLRDDRESSGNGSWKTFNREDIWKVNTYSNLTNYTDKFTTK